MSYHIIRGKKEVALRGAPRVTLIEKLGLEGVAEAPKALRAVENGKNRPVSLLLGEGTFEDPRNRDLGILEKHGPTGGFIAIQSEITLDEDREVTSLHMDVFTLHPSGSQELQRLFELECKGQNITSIRILGEPLPDNLLKESAPRVIETIASIHHDLREKRFPKLGSVLGNLSTLNAVRGGRALGPLTADGGFQFNVFRDDQERRTDTWSVPERFLSEILGLGRNDIDTHHVLPPQLTVARSSDRGDAEYQFGFAQELKDKGRSFAIASRIFDGRTRQSLTTPDPFALSFRLKDGTAQLEHFAFLGEYSKDAPSSILQKRLGVVNAINTSLRQRQFPYLDDLLAAFDQLDIRDALGFANVGSLDGMVMTHRKLGGNNDHELLPGFGGTIGINCDVLMAHWQDDKGRNRRVGVCIDPGKMFNRVHQVLKGHLGDWDYAIADVQSYLKDIDHIFITHWHEDHVTLLDLARRGLLVNKNVHLLPYAAQVAQTEFESDAYLRKHRHLWPNFVSHSKPDLTHIVADDQRRLSVFFGALIPHTTDCSPVVVAMAPYACDAEGKALHASPKKHPNAWTFATLGDCTFGPFNAYNYSGGIIPPDRAFTHDMWNIYADLMGDSYVDLGKAGKRQLRKKPADIVFLDATNADQKGWAPDIVKGEEDLVKLGTWCQGLAMRLLYFASNKRGDEMVLRAALRLQRNITVAGLNHQRRWGDLDKAGLRFSQADGRTVNLSIQESLFELARQYQVDPVQYLTLGRAAVRQLFEADPGRMIVVGTGGLNTPIEVQAHGPKAATFRDPFVKHSRFSRTAFGLPPSAFLNVIAQNAFSGTEEEQRKMAYDLAFGLDSKGRESRSGGSTVVLVTHNGSYFYNVKDPYAVPIRDGLKQLGYDIKPEPGIQGFYVPGFMPAYASGHGRENDITHIAGWLKDNGINCIAATHYGERKKADALHKIVAQNGIAHPPEPIANWTVHTMLGGEGNFTAVGPAIKSAVLVRHDYPYGQHWLGDRTYIRAVFDTGHVGNTLPGFFHSQRGPYVLKFGQADMDAAHRTAETGTAPLRHGPDTARKAQAPAVTDYHLVPWQPAKLPLPRSMPSAPDPGGEG